MVHSPNLGGLRNGGGLVIFGASRSGNRLVEAVGEMALVDHCVRESGTKFDWEQVLEALEGEKGRPVSDF